MAKVIDLRKRKAWRNLKAAVKDDKIRFPDSADLLRTLPGYPFLPCPICRGIEGCDHTVPERATAKGYDTGDYRRH